jgi:hypothetical protein
MVARTRRGCLRVPGSQCLLMTLTPGARGKTQNRAINNIWSAQRLPANRLQRARPCGMCALARAGRAKVAPCLALGVAWRALAYR